MKTDLHAREQRINVEIESRATAMGGYHGPLFAEACGKQMARLLSLSDSEMMLAVAEWSRNWMSDVKAERERILGIDAMASSLLPGHEALVRAAKFTDPCTAGELAERIISTEREFMHRMPTARQ